MKQRLLVLWRRLLGWVERQSPATGAGASVFEQADPVPHESLVRIESVEDEKRKVDEEVPPERRRMSGTRLYLALSDLTPDQQQWFTTKENDWLDMVDPSGQDFHLVHDPQERRWQVRLGHPEGPELTVQPHFAVQKWGADGIILRRRLMHLFMDRNEIPGQIFVYRKGNGELFEKETVRPK